jgi:hypothetical protein
VLPELRVRHRFASHLREKSEPANPECRAKSTTSILCRPYDRQEWEAEPNGDSLDGPTKINQQSRNVAPNQQHPFSHYPYDHQEWINHFHYRTLSNDHQPDHIVAPVYGIPSTVYRFAAEHIQDLRHPTDQGQPGWGRRTPKPLPPQPRPAAFLLKPMIGYVDSLRNRDRRLHPSARFEDNTLC